MPSISSFVHPLPRSWKRSSVAWCGVKSLCLFLTDVWFWLQKVLHLIKNVLQTETKVLSCGAYFGHLGKQKTMMTAWLKLRIRFRSDFSHLWQMDGQVEMTNQTLKIHQWDLDCGLRLESCKKETPSGNEGEDRHPPQHLCLQEEAKVSTEIDDILNIP